MDNPWATTWEQPNDRQTLKEPTPTTSSRSPIDVQTHDQEEDLGLSSWSTGDATQWPDSSHNSDAIWTSSIDDSSAWGSSTYSKINLSRPQPIEVIVESETQETDIVPTPSQPISIPNEEDSVSSSDAVEFSVALPTVEAVPLVPESPNIFGGFEAGVSAEERDEGTEDGGEAWADPVTVSTEDGDEWGAAWAETLSQDASVSDEVPPDEWEAARQEKEKLNRAVPPEFLTALIQKCQEVTSELWPQTPLDSDATKSNWRTGFDGLENITVLLNDLVPENMTLPPLVQFSQTATAKEMSNSLKLTRHMPLTRKSPMAHLLASKGSMEWEKSVRARKDVPADDTPVGWRILEKDDRISISEATQLKKPGGGLLSFLNRKVSSVPATDTKVETLRSPPVSTRTSVEMMKSPVPERRDASPARMPAVVVPSSPVASSFATPDIAIPTVTPAPSAVSRFLNRFSRGKSAGSERKSLALSTDDLEFLSDIVPSTHNPNDSNDDPQLKALSNMINSTSTSISSSASLPPKLPPPLAPPPQPPSVNTNQPPSVAGSSGLRTMEPGRGSLQPTPARVPSLPPPLSPARATSFSRPHSPAVPPKLSPPPTKAVSPTYSSPNISAAIPYISSSPQPLSGAHSPFQFLPPPKAPSTLSIPPLLPPPPISPPQTPRPLSVATLPTSISNAGRNDATWSATTYQDDDDDDDSFSAFSSLPRESTFHEPRESIESSLGSPSSAHALNSSKSMSFDDFDDFVASPRLSSPSPPPVPAKPANVVGGGARMAGSKPSSSIHQRTQSLLELAASQHGQWPSIHVRPTLPPPPPPPAFSSLSSDMDLLGDVLSTQNPGSPLPKGKSALSPSPPPPPLMSQQPLPFVPLSPSLRAQRAPAEPGKKGGLTAQDLSFFEGF